MRRHDRFGGVAASMRLVGIACLVGLGATTAAVGTGCTRALSFDLLAGAGVGGGTPPGREGSVGPPPDAAATGGAPGSVSTPVKPSSSPPDAQGSVGDAGVAADGGGVDGGVDSRRADAGFDRDTHLPFPFPQRPQPVSCTNKVFPRPLRVSDVMLVVGRNGSMAMPFGAGATRIQAVEAKVESVIMSYPNAIHFGYVDFPTADASSCTASQAPIMPNTGTYNPISAALKPCDGGALTAGCLFGDILPIADALGVVSTSFLHPMPGDYRRDFSAILVTDGAPGCGPTDNAQTACKAATDKAYGNSQAMPPIKTYVIALVDSKTSDVQPCLKSIASSGGGSGLAQAAADANDLQLAFDSILGGLARMNYCSIDLTTYPNWPNLKGDSLTLRISGRTIPYDPAGTMPDGGWSANDPANVGQIQVHGLDCEALQRVSTDAVDISSTACLPQN